MDDTIHLYTFDYNKQVTVECGKVGALNKLAYAYTPNDTTCYTCLDCAVERGKQCAERLTELPPRVS